ncbi:MAG: ester cyclase, partial [Pseudomonadota bacterium]
CQTGADHFLSSHRLLCRATHRGTGMYGPPTGRSLTYRILADCWCRGNAVHDEWLVRDQAAIVQQMGHDIVDWTRDLIAREGGPAACVRPFTPDHDIAGPYQGRGNDHPFGRFMADVLTCVMAGHIGYWAQVADRAVTADWPGHHTTYGHHGVQQFWLALRSAFPSAQFQIDHVIGQTSPYMPPRAALRWSLWGTHDGWGRYGKPTGAQVYVMGITHVEQGPRGLKRLWTLIDDTAIWKQIILTTG